MKDKDKSSVVNVVQIKQNQFNVVDRSVMMAILSITISILIAGFCLFKNVGYIDTIVGLNNKIERYEKYSKLPVEQQFKSGFMSGMIYATKNISSEHWIVEEYCKNVVLLNGKDIWNLDSLLRTSKNRFTLTFMDGKTKEILWP